MADFRSLEDRECEEDRIERLEAEVQGHLKSKLEKSNAARKKPSPQTVLGLCRDVDRCIEAECWFAATSSCAVLAELLYCSFSGESTYKIPQKSSDKRVLIHEPLAILRNTCFHPAGVVPTQEHPRSAIDELCKVIDCSDSKLARNLRDDWTVLREEDLLVWALWRLNDAGLVQLGKPASSVLSPRNTLINHKRKKRKKRK